MPGFPVTVLNTVGAGDACRRADLRPAVGGGTGAPACGAANACGALVVAQHVAARQRCRGWKKWRRFSNLKAQSRLRLRYELSGEIEIDMEHLIRSAGGATRDDCRHAAESGWQCLSFRVVMLAGGSEPRVKPAAKELAIQVPLRRRNAGGG